VRALRYCTADVFTQRKRACQKCVSLPRVKINFVCSWPPMNFPRILARAKFRSFRSACEKGSGIWFVQLHQVKYNSGRLGIISNTADTCKPFGVPGHSSVGHHTFTIPFFTGHQSIAVCAVFGSRQFGPTPASQAYDPFSCCSNLHKIHWTQQLGN
jgi:hypothetical protein